MGSRVAIFFLKLISYLPFWIIYILADIFYFVTYYIVGYRKKVVYQNLQNSFPEKSETEIKAIAKKFFQHFADMMLETFKSYSMPLKTFEKRINLTAVYKTFNEEFEQGRSVIFYSTHYANWEWMTPLAHYLQHKVLLTYRVLKNPHFEKYVTGLRTRFGAHPLPMEQTIKTILGHHRDKELTLSWFCADQAPPANTKFWTTFLNQETPFFQGADKIAAKTNQPVYFLDLQKIRRGYYKGELIKFSDNPKDLPENEILKMYANQLEKIIRKKPEYWLWSHKRWKHKRPKSINLAK